MKRVFLSAVIVLVVSVLALGACAAPVPAPTPLPAPAPSPAPAPAPKPTVAPTPVPTSAPTPVTEKPIELKFAHFNPPGAWTVVKWIDPWAKKVEEATNGKVKIVMYPARTLATEQGTYTAVEYDVADMGWIVVGMIKGRFPLTEVLTLPFVHLPSGTVNGQPYSAGKVNSRMLQELYETFPEIQAEWSTVKLLYMSTGEPMFTATAKKPVRNQKDLQGLKIRALAGGSADTYKLLGASPIILPLPDVYEALQKGVIDGMAAAWSQVQNYRLYEVLRYYTPATFTTDVFGTVMNRDKWNSLSPEIQKAIMSVSGMNGAEFAGDSAFGNEVKTVALDIMKKAGKEMEMVNLDPGEVEKWQQLSKPLLDKWVAEMKAKGLPGQKVLDEALKLREKYK